MSKLIIIFFTILFLSGCQVVLKKMYGIKSPKIENNISIKKKAFKYGLDTTNIVTLNSANFLQTFNEIRGVPDGNIYDSKGNYIEYKLTDTSCNAGLFNFIPGLSPEKTYEKTGEPSLEIELNKYRTLTGNKVETKIDNKFDFYLVIYWTVWIGKLNKDHVKIWEEQAKNNNKAKIGVIKVNLDIQEYWDKEERDKIIKIMSNKQ